MKGIKKKSQFKSYNILLQSVRLGLLVVNACRLCSS